MCEMERHDPRIFQEKYETVSCHPHNLLPAAVGVTYELCAGIVDKPDLSLEEIACKEILEECGYDVPVSNLTRISSYRSGVGVTGSKQTMFYAEVTDSMKTEKGGGTVEEGELIEVVELPLAESISFSYNENFSKNYGSPVWFHVVSK